MKAKAAKFKNPFDLMEDEQQPIVQIKQEPIINHYVPKGKVHTPLPFDPYENPTTASNSTVKQDKTNQPAVSYASIIKENKKSVNKGKAGFTNPFGSELQQQQLEPVNTNRGPMAFNPSTTPESRGFSQQEITYTGELNQDGDPPLLQDIGIDISLIKQRLLMTIKVQNPQYQQLQNTDLAGPIAVALIFGLLLLLSGKVHFGDIYAMFLFGNSIMYFLINFMNQSDIIPLYNVMSTLGYSLLPMLALGFLGIFFSLKGNFGILISLSIAFWSSLAAGNTLQMYLKQPHNSRKYLLVYPLFLFYLCFGMIVIF